MAKPTGAAAAPFAVKQVLIFTKRQAPSGTKRHEASRSVTKRHEASPSVTPTNVHEMIFSQAAPFEKEQDADACPRVLGFRPLAWYLGPGVSRRPVGRKLDAQ